MQAEALLSSLTPMSRRFAAFICRLAGRESPELRLAAALVCHAAEQGHVCLDLKHLPDLLSSIEELPEVRLPDPLHWAKVLSAQPVVGRSDEDQPLVLSDARLYLQRFWRQEEFLSADVRRRAADHVTLEDEALARDGLNRLFGRQDSATAQSDWQRVAAVTALTRRFCVISGGPGTGKTSTVVKILALLLEQARVRPMRIALAAPTGKAAARLAESIGAARDHLDMPASVRDAIPLEAVTLHRLLGRSARKRGFIHDADNPLDLDLVVVDEASMVDLPLMAALFAALSTHCRLILLGDRDQLASVEAGAVLANICGPPRSVVCSPQHAETVERLSGDRLPSAAVTELNDAVVFLRRSYRFTEDSGIGALARAVNEGDDERAYALLCDDGQGDLAWQDLPATENLSESLEPVILSAFRPYLTASSPAEALALFDRFRFLCAVRQGPWGVENLNRLTASILTRRGLIAPRGAYYRGRPILITGNDYRLGLFNGDIGLLWPDQEAGGALRAFFPRQDAPPRALSPSRLPAHETVFAMTVHKSQGSEFDRVLLLLPDRHSGLLTRELLYTAITRARHSVAIHGTRDVFGKAVNARVHRHTGLMEKLWGGGETRDEGRGTRDAEGEKG